MGKIGVLVVNLGTPDDPERGAVYRYLKQFLLDKRVIDIPWLRRQLLVRGIIAPFRSKASSEIYKMLWTKEGSPIKIYGNKVVSGLQDVLGEDYIVELAMRYQSPSIEKKVNKLVLEDNVDKLIVFPMFPHYASASTGSAHEEVMRVLSTNEVIPDVRFINSYPDNKAMIEVFVSNAKKHNIDNYDHIIFSFHGIPQRQMTKADPTKSHCLKVENCCAIMCEANKHCYSAQCHVTAQKIIEALELSEDQYTISYQSRLGKTPWMEPHTMEIIDQLAKSGTKKILAFSASFVSDCLETTVEIGMEYKDEFLKRGGEQLDLVESLNDHPVWINGIADMVKRVG